MAKRCIPRYPMANALSIRHFILGLLTRQSMSGYDIKRFLKSLNWLIDSPSFGSLYPALHALLEDGLATVEVIPRPDKPPRKIYTITDAGRETLREWMNRSTEASVSLKAFLMHLILANNLTHDDLIAYLQQRRSQVATHQLALEQQAEENRAGENWGNGADIGERLALDYGLAVATAELAWLDRTLVRLSQST